MIEARAKQGTKPERSELAGLSTPELVQRYGVGVENFDRRLFELSDEQIDRTFDAGAGVGEWSARVLLGHCADAELAFVHRLRRAVAEDGPVFGVWDENAFIDAGLYGKPGGKAGGSRQAAGGFVAVMHTLRAWTREWLATLDERTFARRAMHPQRGPQSVRDVLEYATWHLEHHAWYLHRKLERLGPPAGKDGHGHHHA